MSLIDDLVTRAADLVDDKSNGWIDTLVREGRDLVDANGDATLGAGGSTAAHEALNILTANREPFQRLGKLGFARIVALWQDKQEAEARRRYLSTTATYDERRAAMHAAGDAATAEADERRKAWEAVMATLKQIGTLGLKFLANLGAKSVGLPITF